MVRHEGDPRTIATEEVPMRVQEIMNRKVETIASDDSASTALERMRVRRIHHLVVVQGRRPVGVVSSRDLDLGKDGDVRDVMSAPAVSATPDMTIRKAANLLRGRSIGCLPVMERGKLVGIVTTTDLLERIGRGSERPITRGKRWTLKGRGPRRKSVVGHKGFAAH
jgi:acetoin utilization protein AcuB